MAADARLVFGRWQHHYMSTQGEEGGRRGGGAQPPPPTPWECRGLTIATTTHMTPLYMQVRLGSVRIAP